MKNLIIILIAAVGGYYAYQYFTGSYINNTSELSENSEPFSLEYIPDMPEECEIKGRNMGDAIYGYDIGRVSVAQLNNATRSFQSCLRNAGFSDTEISATYEKLREDVMNLNPGSSRGY